VFVLNGIVDQFNNPQTRPDIQKTTDGGQSWSQVGDATPFQRYGTQVLPTGNGDEMSVEWI
jgi:hypothetical protein